MRRQRSVSPSDSIADRMAYLERARSRVGQERQLLESRRRRMPEKYWQRLHEVDAAMLDIAASVFVLEEEVIENEFWRLREANEFWRLREATGRLSDVAFHSLEALPGPHTQSRALDYQRRAERASDSVLCRLREELGYRFGLVSEQLMNVARDPVMVRMTGLDIHHTSQWLAPEAADMFAHAPVHHQIVIVEELETFVVRASRTRRQG